MLAVVLTKYGAPFQEVSMPRPTPGPNQVVVQVVAAGINHADERTRVGEFKLLVHPHLPAVAGGELSGHIVAVGSEVSRFTIGDALIAYTGVANMGAYAEFALVDQDALAPAPTSIPLVDAAALPVVGLTAWHALVTLGQVQPGQRVLVHGGSGGVGSIAVQLAAHLGATVIATASAANADVVRSLGADEVIDYRSEDFVQRLADAPVDFVLDTQGGKTTTGSLEVLRPGGLVVGIAGTPDPALADQLGAPLPVKLALAGLSARLRRRAHRLGVRYRFLLIEPDGAALERLVKLVDDGILKPLIDRILPADQTLDALQQLLSGGVRGKVLVTREPGAVGPDLPTTWAETPNSRVTVNGDRLVYRDLGPRGGTPVVLLTHLGATLDKWDPAVVDALAARHRVVALELAGVGGSTGAVPGTIREMADTARDYLRRLSERVMDRDQPMSPRGFTQQISAIRRWGNAAPHDLSRITAPTLIANGDQDRMVPSDLSEDMHRRIPNSTLIVYPGTGHGGVFQNHEQFTEALLAHLEP